MRTSIGLRLFNAALRRWAARRRFGITAYGISRVTTSSSGPFRFQLLAVAAEQVQVPCMEMEPEVLGGLLPRFGGEPIPGRKPSPINHVPTPSRSCK